MCWAHVGGPVFGRRASELVHVKVRAPGLVLADRHAVLRSTHMKGGVEAAARDFGTRSFAQLVAWRRHKTDPLPCRACVALVPGMPAGRRGDGGRGGYVTNENVPSSRLPWRLQRPSCVDKVVVRARLYPMLFAGCAPKRSSCRSELVPAALLERGAFRCEPWTLRIEGSTATEAACRIDSGMMGEAVVVVDSCRQRGAATALRSRVAAGSQCRDSDCLELKLPPLTVLLELPGGEARAVKLQLR
jgi:hypothetical protein